MRARYEIVARRPASRTIGKVYWSFDHFPIVQLTYRKRGTALDPIQNCGRIRLNPAALRPQAGSTNMELLMTLKFLTKQIHAYLDYPVAIGLIVLPFVLGLGSAGPVPVVLSVATGIAAFILTLLTDHELGVWRVIPFRVHEIVDGLVGVTFLLAPFALGLSGLAATYFWVIGATVMTVLALTDRQRDTEVIA